MSERRYAIELPWTPMGQQVRDLAARLRTYAFWIRRTHESPLERIEIKARDSVNAIEQLPACVYWDFAGGKTA